MARIAQGKEVLKQAMELLFSARTAKELRQAQAGGAAISANVPK